MPARLSATALAALLALLGTLAMSRPVLSKPVPPKKNGPAKVTPAPVSLMKFLTTGPFKEYNLVLGEKVDTSITDDWSTYNTSTLDAFAQQLAWNHNIALSRIGGTGSKSVYVCYTALGPPTTTSQPLAGPSAAASGQPAANVVRAYHLGGVWVLQVSSATVGQVMETLQQLSVDTVTTEVDPDAAGTMLTNVYLTDITIPKLMQDLDTGPILSAPGGQSKLQVTVSSANDPVVAVHLRGRLVTRVWPLTFVHSNGASQQNLSTVSLGPASALESGTPPPPAPGSNNSSGAQPPAGPTPGPPVAPPTQSGPPANPPTPGATPAPLPPAPTDNPSNSTAQNIAQQLNYVFGAPAVAPQYLTSSGDNLIIRAPNEIVDEIERMLATDIDIPYSQVRVNIWAFQVSAKNRGGNVTQDQFALQTIGDGVRMTRDLNVAIQSAIQGYVRKHKTDIGNNYIAAQKNYLSGKLAPGCKVENVDLLADAGIDSKDLDRPLTRTELLTLFAFANKSPSDLDDLVDSAMDSYAASRGLTGKVGDPVDSTKDIAGITDPDQILLQKLWDAVRTSRKSNKSALPRFSAFFDADQQTAVSGDTGSDANTAGQNAILRFLVCNEIAQRTNADRFSRAVVFGSEDIDPFVALTGSSAATDSLIKLATDALSDDLDDLLMEPLIHWARSDIASNTNGLSFAGSTSLAVTSRVPGQTVAQGITYSALTPLETPAGLATALGSGSSLTTVFGGLSNLGALAYAGLSGAPATNYGAVAPGISMGVVPTVMKDGDTARLQITLLAGSQVDEPSSSSQVPLDYVKGHSVVTDVQVSAMDLFELSTFGMDVVRPGDYAWHIPVLEGIPVLGDMFHGARTRDVTHLESLLIVGVSIIPRSLDLARYEIGVN
ncbi:MAG: hypothetical protein ACLQVD_13740 [Capsulimonadaceae bacterium]